MMSKKKGSSDRFTVGVEVEVSIFFFLALCSSTPRAWVSLA